MSQSLHICFCRSDTSRSELAELSKQANPDEIDIDDDDDDDDDEGQGPEGEWEADHDSDSKTEKMSTCLNIRAYMF